jgi:hypothetical protein
MNAVPDCLLGTPTITDGAVALPLRHPDVPTLSVALDVVGTATSHRQVERGKRLF